MTNPPEEYVEQDVLISIVIAGYNAGNYLRDVFDSIDNQSYRNFEVIFINNGSTDETGDVLKAYPHITTINNEKNMGFCYATNHGIRISKGKYVLTLNSDIILDKDFLMSMKRAIDRDDAALFGSKILKTDKKRIDSTGLMLSWSYRFFDRGNGDMDFGQYDEKEDIFGPCAAAALYKKEMLEGVKYKGEYFDEGFFFLGEDFDLAWRARRQSWKARFVPDAVCYHYRNSSRFSSQYKQYLSFRNRFFLLIKNGSFNIKYPLIFVLYDVPRLFYMLFTNIYTVRAIRELIRCTPEMIKKRHSRDMSAISKNRLLRP